MTLRKGEIRQTISVRHHLTEDDLARLDPLRREQSKQTRLAYVRAAVKDGTTVENGRTVPAWTKVEEKVVRDAVKALAPAVVGDSRTLGHAVRRGCGVRVNTPDGTAVFGSRKEARRRTKGLIGHADAQRSRLLPLYLCGDRLCRGNAIAKLVMTLADGTEVAARAAPVDPLPKKRERPLLENTKFPRKSGGVWLRHAPPAGAVLHEAMPGDLRVQSLRLALRDGPVTVPLSQHRGKQCRLLARVAWAGSAGLANVTVQVDDEHVHVTFDPKAVAFHPERRVPTPFVPGRSMGIDRNPNAIGGAVIDMARLDGIARPDLPGTVVDHLLVLPNLDRHASAEETAEAMSTAADAFVGLARKNGCGIIVVENLRNLRGGGTRSRRLNHLLSRWCRTRFLQILKRRAELAGIRVLEAWAGYSTTVGNVLNDLPDSCASGAEMARRGLVLEAHRASGKAAEGDKPQLLPAFDEGHVLGRLQNLPPSPETATVQRKEGTRAVRRMDHKARLARLVEKAKHVAGWVELHRTIGKSGIRARRTHPVGASRLYASARCGPSPTGRRLRLRAERGGNAVSA